MMHSSICWWDPVFCSRCLSCCSCVGDGCGWTCRTAGVPFLPSGFLVLPWQLWLWRGSLLRCTCSKGKWVHGAIMQCQGE